MAATAAIATVGVGVLSAKGQRDEGKYQKAVLEQNARISEELAADAIERGKFEEGRQRLEVRQVIGSQRASMAAQGIEINDPDDSAGAVQLSTRAQGELDALLIRNNAAREAWGYKVQATDQMAQAKLTDIASKNRARDTILGSIVKGADIYSSAGGKLPGTGNKGATVPSPSGRMTVHSPKAYAIT